MPPKNKSKKTKRSGKNGSTAARVPLQDAQVFAEVAVTPVPSLPLADALLYADTMPQVLQILAQGLDRWMEAIVLATPFWAPGTGRLNQPVDLVVGIPPLMAASLRFDPGRELRIRQLVPQVLGESTKGLLATLERIRVESHFLSAVLLLLIPFMPKLTSIHLGSADQLDLLLTSIPHSVQELGVSSFPEEMDLSMLQPLTSLRKLTLDGCKDLTDITALKSLTKLEELRLSGCKDLVDVSPLASLTSLRAPAIGDVDADSTLLDDEAAETTVPCELLGTYAASLRSDDPATRAHGEVMIRKIVSVDRNPWAYDEDSDGEDIPVDLLMTYIDFMRSSVPAENLQGARMIRCGLDADDCWLEDGVHLGCVSLLVHHLLCDDLPELQRECARAITRIAEYGEVDSITSNPHILLHLIRLIISPVENCRVNAARAIEAIASGSIAGRDYCIKKKAVEILVVVADISGGVTETYESGSLALSSCCRGLPPPEVERVADALPLLAAMLHNGKEDIVESGATALSDLLEGSADLIDRICSIEGCVSGIVELLNVSEDTVRKPAASCVRNIVRGRGSQVQALIDAGALQKFPSMLDDSEVSIRENAAESVSIMTANHPNQIPNIVAEDIFPALLKAAKAGNAGVTEHAVRALLNTMSSPSVHMDYFVSIGALQCLAEVAAQRDERTAGIALEAMEKITKTLKPAC